MLPLRVVIPQKVVVNGFRDGEGKQDAVVTRIPQTHREIMVCARGKPFLGLRTTFHSDQPYEGHMLVKGGATGKSGKINECTFVQYNSFYSLMQEA